MRSPAFYPRASRRERYQPFDVTKIRLIIGGDHGKGAFRLCFRTVINVEGEKKPIYKTKSIAEVYCAKEEGIVLENSIMPWLTEDLKKIHNSQLRIRTSAQDDDTDGNGGIIRGDNGNIICDYSAKTLASCTTPNTKVVSNIEMFVAGDLSFYSLLLGKEGASSSSCPYCMLTKKEWSIEGHEKGELWTIEKLIAMAQDDIKKGAAKIGVKCIPTWDFIPVANYVISLTHLGIGLDNDALNLFADVVEWTIIKLPPQEQGQRDRYIALEDLIKSARLAVNVFNQSPEGKERARLDKKNKKTTDKMTTEDLCL